MMLRWMMAICKCWLNPPLQQQDTGTDNESVGGTGDDDPNSEGINGGTANGSGSDDGNLEMSIGNVGGTGRVDDSIEAAADVGGTGGGAGDAETNPRSTEGIDKATGNAGGTGGDSIEATADGGGTSGADAETNHPTDELLEVVPLCPEKIVDFHILNSRSEVRYLMLKIEVDHSKAEGLEVIVKGIRKHLGDLVAKDCDLYFHYKNRQGNWKITKLPQGKEAYFEGWWISDRGGETSWTSKQGCINSAIVT
jgi:hypothetical protein